MSILELIDVTKIYTNPNEDVTAVKDFNLEITDKEFIILVGPSGCGKTTVLRMIAGLEEVTEGKILIDGKLANNLMPKDRDIAMVFQSYALYPYMSVYDNLAFGLESVRVLKEEIKRKIKEVARILEIEHLLERRPNALSGGQKQRVALGRAIVKHPKIFLMDEPLSNLDAKMRAQMRVEIIRLYRRLGIPVIYVTHDQVEAMTMGSRIVVMNNGIIQQVDKPDVIYNKPANVFVGSFFGTPPMNFFKGTLIEKNGNLFFRIIEVGEGRIKNMVKRVEMERDLKISPTRSKEMKSRGCSNYIDKEVLLGIRPEHIYAENEMIEKHRNSVIKSKIDIVESLGMEKLLYTKVGNNITLTSKVKSDFNYKQNDEVPLAIDTNWVHVFDKATEEALFN